LQKYFLTFDKIIRVKYCCTETTLKIKIV